MRPSDRQILGLVARRGEPREHEQDERHRHHDDAAEREPVARAREQVAAGDDEREEAERLAHRLRGMHVLRAAPADVGAVREPRDQRRASIASGRSFDLPASTTNSSAVGDRVCGDRDPERWRRRDREQPVRATGHGGSGSPMKPSMTSYAVSSIDHRVGELLGTHRLELRLGLHAAHQVVGVSGVAVRRHEAHGRSHRELRARAR